MSGVVKLSIAEVNRLDYEDFMTIFDNIVEKRKCATEFVWQHRPFRDVGEMGTRFIDYIQQMTRKEKLDILSEMTDLNAVIDNSLSKESRDERIAGGFGRMSKEDQETLDFLNARYRQKFGFTFVICARENTVNTFIEAIQTRLSNDIETDINNGIDQLCIVTKIRLRNLVLSEHS